MPKMNPIPAPKPLRIRPTMSQPPRHPTQNAAVIPPDKSRNATHSRKATAPTHRLNPFCEENTDLKPSPPLTGCETSGMVALIHER